MTITKLGLTLAAAAAGLVTGLGTGLAVASDDDPPPLPRCGAEDDVIEGVGDYRPDGTWTRYRCTHPDILPTN